MKVNLNVLLSALVLLLTAAAASATGKAAANGCPPCPFCH